MPDYSFKFKNDNNKDEFNDVVYEGPAFSLEGMTYSFTIVPQKTQFWRFGIRLSETPDVPFFHPITRHKEGIMDIHLSVGEFDGKQWTSPNRFEVGQYHIPNTKQLLSRSDLYKSMSRVIWRIRLLPGYEDQNFLAMEYMAADAPPFQNRVVIPATYKYFQVFAWSDKNEFELDCIITGVNVTSENAKNENSLCNYWLLKINPKSFDIPDFYEGSEIWFGTHNTRFAERPEYRLYFNVKQGDRVLGYAFSPYDEVIWDMVVDLDVHSDKTYGECIKLSIIDILEPRIPIDDFREILPSNIETILRPDSPVRLVAISQQFYLSILNSVSGSRKKKICYFPSYKTEGNHKATPDQLQLEYDIEALASVIALKEVTPPLAVGLFGNWGSGKSFFMEKLEDKIGEYATREERYVRHVVHVRFNSWHYCDTNLWASLITEIFESLKRFSKVEGQEEEVTKLIDTLQSTSLQKEAVIETKMKLQAKVDELTADEKEKRAQLQDVTGFKLLKIILNDPFIKSDFSKLNNHAIVSIMSDREKVDGYLEELNDTGNQIRYFIREFFNLKNWKWVVVILFAIIVFCLVIILTKIYPEVWLKITSWIATGTAAIAAIFTRVMETLKPFRRNIAEAAKRLKSLRDTIEARTVSDNSELPQGQREIQELKDSLLALDLKITQTKEKLHDVATGKRLGEFIDQRSSDEQYSKGLGMVSWIRKDFVMLDKLLREQYVLSDKQREEFSNPRDVKLQIDRIVLYIDDLDRCNEDVVIKVLEAIHLLLAFPLFVVIVGVDPRWLNNALNNKLGSLFSSSLHSDQADNKPIGKAATSYDYLEKIFQIPFALKEIGVTGRERLIDYLMRPDLIKPENFPTIQPAQQANNENQAVEDSMELFDTVTIEEIPDTLPLGRVKLSFKIEELDFIKKLSVIFGQTPRSIKRFVNIYMIIKSHRSLAIKDVDNYKEYYPVIVMLAVVVGCSEIAASFMGKLNDANDDEKFITFLNRIANNPDSPSIKEIVQQYKDLFDPEVSMVNLSTFKANAGLVSRFSFRQILP